MTAEALDVLILAAGGARRFGGCKLLAPWRGIPILEHVLNQTLELPVNSVHVVLGGHMEEMENYFRQRPERKEKLLFNPAWQSGMGQSLAFGVAQLPAENAVLVLLADQPLIAGEDLKKICALWCENPARIVCAEFAGTRGVPALFPSKNKNHLKRLSGDKGAKMLLSGDDALTLPLAGAAVDIDQPSDLMLLPL